MTRVQLCSVSHSPAPEVPEELLEPRECVLGAGVTERARVQTQVSRELVSLNRCHTHTVGTVGGRDRVWPAGMEDGAQPGGGTGRKAGHAVIRDERHVLVLLDLHATHPAQDLNLHSPWSAFPSVVLCGGGQDPELGWLCDSRQLTASPDSLARDSPSVDTEHWAEQGDSDFSPK